MYRLRGMASTLRMRFFCSFQLATVVAWHVSLKRSHFWHPLQTVVIWLITFKLATSLAYLFFLRRYQAIVAMATKHTKPTTTARAIKTDLCVEEDFRDLSELRPEASGDVEMISFSPIKTTLIPICCSISGATFVSSCFIISRGIMLLFASVGILTTSFTLKSSMSFQVFGYPWSMMISSSWKVRAFFWLCVSGFLMKERSGMVYSANARFWGETLRFHNYQQFLWCFKETLLPFGKYLAVPLPTSYTTLKLRS